MCEYMNNTVLIKNVYLEMPLLFTINQYFYVLCFWYISHVLSKINIHLIILQGTLSIPLFLPSYYLLRTWEAKMEGYLFYLAYGIENIHKFYSVLLWQWKIKFSSVYICVYSVFILKFVSSANILGSSAEELERLLTYYKKSNGPSNEPCVNPQRMFWVPILRSWPNTICCFLFAR